MRANGTRFSIIFALMSWFIVAGTNFMKVWQAAHQSLDACRLEPTKGRLAALWLGGLAVSDSLGPNRSPTFWSGVEGCCIIGTVPHICEQGDEPKSTRGGLVLSEQFNGNEPAFGEESAQCLRCDTGVEA